MNKIDWKRKWTSRKFLSMLVVLVTAVTGFFTSDDPTVQIFCLISAVVDIVVYIGGESYIDGAAQYAQAEKDLQYCKRTIDEVARQVNELRAAKGV